MTTPHDEPHAILAAVPARVRHVIRFHLGVLEAVAAGIATARAMERLAGAPGRYEWDIRFGPGGAQARLEASVAKLAQIQALAEAQGLDWAAVCAALGGYVAPPAVGPAVAAWGPQATLYEAEKATAGAKTKGEAMTDRSDHQAIQVGTIAVATRASGVCAVGETGVCYEVYTLGGRPGYSFLFERGGYDGFSPEDVVMFLTVTDMVCMAVADYQFTDVTRLMRDFRQDCFAEAFARRPCP